MSGHELAHRKAAAWCEENGYSVGEMCGPQPIGIMRGEWQIAKWRNLTKREQDQLDGTITGNFRDGPVKVTIFATPGAST